MSKYFNDKRYCHCFDIPTSDGLSTNSVSSDNRTYNTFNVQGGAGQDVSNLARAIRREFDLGRA